ncbi:Hydrolase [Pseudohongiella spirulinae]|uniref:Hydrolase n=2 Tax=Pseudohongiella spirulinae TaxID=1249552 RepID=A0A0S2K8Z7_9GAMM|nr:Hydrolase [Pseudohongiella spirulinae]
MFITELHGSWLHHPFWKSRFLLEDADDLAKLKSSGIKMVSVDLAKSLPGAVSSLEGKKEPPETSPRPPGVTEEEKPQKAARSDMQQELNRARQLCEYSREAVTAMFKEARMGKAISGETATEIVTQINESVARQPHALIALARLKTSDNYTYMHSVAVCAMMIALARELKLSDAEVKAAGAAGLMHDIGKMAIPDSILNKPGALTDPEFAEMRKHPERGVEILNQLTDIPPEVAEVCLHHHEKYNGTGYPHQLAGELISRMARMGAICDVYDAITSDRPYKKGWGPAESLQKMATWKGHFDPDYFQAFVRTIGIYPVGSLVRLKSQRLAVVIEQNSTSLIKPKVKVFFSLRSKLPLTQAVLDLSAQGVVDSIEAREPSENWNFPYLDDLWQEFG